jgi:hypothetical protein
MTPQPKTPQPKTPQPSIQALMDLFLAELRKTRSKRDGAEVDGSLDLLRSGLEGYGYQYLTRRELERWQAASEDRDLGLMTFCRLFGARALAAYLDEFFGYFMIRKVILSAADSRATIEDVRAFVDWLGRQGYLTASQARKAKGRIARASDELPAAERLGELLHAESEKAAALGPAIRNAPDRRRLPGHRASRSRQDLVH